MPFVAELTASLAWIAAHPGSSLVGAYALLNILNGLLPAHVAAGPIGRGLHALLDRIALLTRSSAPGTLKWPLVGASILRGVVDSLAPDYAGTLRTLARAIAEGAP